MRALHNDISGLLPEFQLYAQYGHTAAQESALAFNHFSFS